MARTIRRNPFSVEVDNDDFNIGVFNQVEFKGICTNKNDVTIDQNTFTAVENVYIDENDVLISRPPVKFYDGEAFTIQEWHFGSYGIRYSRILVDADGNRIDYPQGYNTEDLYYLYILHCITHTCISGTYNGYTINNQLGWQVSVANVGWNAILKITPVQIEDKIYFWVGGQFFVDFNTSGIQASDGNYYPYFEDAVKYLYYPVCKLVINGIESDLETKNFLTETYRRRYRYSADSTVNFDSLIGRRMDINLNGPATQNTSKKLYEVEMQQEQDKMLIYPYSSIGNNYYMDIVQTPRATVFMRYNYATQIIEVSFDGRYFRGLPIVEDIIGEPLLSKDGMWCIAFTAHGVAQCRLVAQETEDFVEERVFSWTVNPYMRKSRGGDNGLPLSINDIDISFVPRGYFETIDNFAYVFKAPSIDTDIDNNIVYMYAEWLNGTNDSVWGYRHFLMQDEEGTIANIIPNDNIKVHFRYVSPTSNHQDLGAVVSIFTADINLLDENDIITAHKNRVLISFFKQNMDAVGRTVKNNDLLFIAEVVANPTTTSFRGWRAFVYKLTADGTRLVHDETTINSGDLVLYTPVPVTASIQDDYVSSITYNIGDTVTYNSKIYRCVVSCSNIVPTNTSYWEVLTQTDGTPYNSYYELHYSIATDGDVVDYTTRISWEIAYLVFLNGFRFRASLVNGTGAIYPGNRIRLESIDFDVVYTPTDLENYFGPFPAASTNIDGSWAMFGNITNRKTATPQSYVGNAYITGLYDTASVERTISFPAIQYVNTSDDTFTIKSLNGPCNQMDIIAMSPTINADEMEYEITLAYGGVYVNDEGLDIYFDIFERITYEYIEETTNVDSRIISEGASYFKILSNTDNVLTDKYFWSEDIIVPLPTNGELSQVITDEQRNVINNDTVYITYTDDTNTYSVLGNVYRLTEDGKELTNEPIISGVLVSYTHNAVNETDYLTPGGISGSIATTSNRFILEKIAVGENNQFVAQSGYIKYGDLVRFRAYDQIITLSADDPGNPTGATLTIQPLVYPAAPSGWQVGDEWPTTDAWMNYSPPILVDTATGGTRIWHAGDILPTGPVMYYGGINIIKRIIPLSIGDDGVWYYIDGMLWTSQVTTDNIVELDEYINCQYQYVTNDEGTKLYRIVQTNYTVPDYSAALSETFLSFIYKGKNLLEITSARRDENKLFDEEGNDLLLYLPKVNEQILSLTITNMHNLSESAMGLFTEDAVYYVSPVTVDDALRYTAPVKSKIPVGCREGDEIITALDGQAIIFPTARGIAAMVPEDFVATTERSLSYLSDAIQDLYYDFYNNVVQSASLVPDEFDTGYRSQIRINTYKYWILFTRYMDRQVLTFDTRTSTWWRWTLPYPIRQVIVTNRLHFMLQIDFNPIHDSQIEFPPVRAPYMGVDFLWTDKEVEILVEDDTDFPTLSYTPIANIGYYDDIISGALNGVSELVYDNEFVGDRRVLQYGSPTIHWYFTSQKLHFNQINNYKLIRALNIIAKGTNPITTKLSTKVYRDLYHPEQSQVMEVQVNDLRTFIKRMNLMHVVNFQYRLENDTNEDTRVQLKLDSLSIKYEIKEAIR